MTPTALDGAVELLERSLSYTRGRLIGVGPGDLGRSTPCADWDLAALLAHMDDGLDAFTEAAAGHVAIDVGPLPESRVEVLQHKACTLLGAWVDHRPPAVTVADASIDPALLVATAALEITLHGWDVGQAIGQDAAIPGDLAEALSGVAHLVITVGPPQPRFAPPRPVAADAPSAERLLAWTGRRTEPPPCKQVIRPARGGLAS